MIQHLLTSFAVAALAILPSSTQAQDQKPWTGVLDEAAFASLHELTEGQVPALLGTDVLVGEAKGYLAIPKTGEMLGAVVVIHEWWGLNEHVKHWTDRLAADGYAALAIDLYGGTVATTRDGAMEAMRAVDSTKALATLRAAHSFLESDERVKAERTACIGWCFGGGWSLQLALAEAKLDAAVIYYGRLVQDAETLRSIQAPVLGIFGNQDTGIPPETVEGFAQAMKTAGRSLTLRQYEANHAFANPSSARYDALNAGLAWTETRKFLCANLWPEASRAGLLTSERKLQSTVPAGWTTKDKGSMRLASLKFGKSSDCAVFAFPGEAGGVLANLDRWGTQMGGVTFTEEQVAALPTIPMLGELGQMIRIDGPYSLKGQEPVAHGTMLAAIASRADETVFVKLLGPTAEVEAQAAAFERYCRSLR